MSTYLFQNPRSDNWYLKITPPGGGKRLEKSLRTNDRKQAELLAFPFIEAHKRALIENRPRTITRWNRELPLGLNTLADGVQVYATETEIRGLDGKVLRPNGGLEQFPDLSHATTAHAIATAFRLADEAPRPRPVAKDSDDSLLVAYLDHGARDGKGLEGKSRHDAELTWQLWRAFANKPLAKCTRDDGRAFVQHLLGVGHKSATVARMRKPLAAAVNYAIKESKYTGANPFAADLVPSLDDSLVRVPFEDSDLETMRANLDKLSPSRALLLRVLAATGMRLGEAFQIDGEKTEGGCRYVVIGTKTANSKRRVPLPASLLPYLPKRISGRLFEGESAIEGGALRRFVREVCGIVDPAKAPNHSFRHRAKDQLRAAACPVDVQYELLGHEVETVAAGYGRGSPVPMLKKWADKIGGL